MSVQNFTMTVSTDARAKVSSSVTELMGADPGDMIELTLEGKAGKAIITGGRVLRGRQAEAAKATQSEARRQMFKSSTAKAAPVKSKPAAKPVAKVAVKKPVAKAAPVAKGRKTAVAVAPAKGKAVKPLVKARR